MPVQVFYAWQSDCDQTVCRFLIRDAVKTAIKRLNADATVSSAPPFELDHATKGTTGHPNIAQTIRRKVKNCGVFLADLTHVAKYVAADGRSKSAQNANVLIELGMAIRAKGFGRLILVMNDAFGPPDDLPFDLKSHSFPTTYTLQPGADKMAAKAVADSLAKAIAEKLKPMLVAINDSEAAKLKAKADSESNVAISCEMAMAGIPGSRFGVEKFLANAVVNGGLRPVTISQVKILLSDGRFAIPAQSRLLGHWKLPKRLEESDKVDVMAEVGPLYDELVKSRLAGGNLSLEAAIATDTTGKSYVSASLEGFDEAELKPI